MKCAVGYGVRHHSGLNQRQRFESDAAQQHAGHPRARVGVHQKECVLEGARQGWIEIDFDGAVFYADAPRAEDSSRGIERKVDAIMQNRNGCKAAGITGDRKAGRKRPGGAGRVRDLFRGGEAHHRRGWNRDLCAGRSHSVSGRLCGARRGNVQGGNRLGTESRATRQDAFKSGFRCGHQRQVARGNGLLFARKPRLCAKATPASPITFCTVRLAHWSNTTKSSRPAPF